MNASTVFSILSALCSHLQPQIFVSNAGTIYQIGYLPLHMQSLRLQRFPAPAGYMSIQDTNSLQIRIMPYIVGERTSHVKHYHVSFGSDENHIAVPCDSILQIEMKPTSPESGPLARDQYSVVQHPGIMIMPRTAISYAVTTNQFLADKCDLVAQGGNVSSLQQKRCGFTEANVLRFPRNMTVAMSRKIDFDFALLPNRVVAFCNSTDNGLLLHYFDINARRKVKEWSIHCRIPLVTTGPFRLLQTTSSTLCLLDSNRQLYSIAPIAGGAMVKKVNKLDYPVKIVYSGKTIDLFAGNVSYHLDERGELSSPARLVWPAPKK